VTVTDPAGEPIAGADVWFTDAVEVRERAETDDAGIARLEASCPERCYLRIEADGYAPWTSEKLTGVTTASASPAPGTPIAGSVHDLETGDPIPGATVRVQDRSSSSFEGAGLPPATTDDAGRYRIDHVPPGSASVSAHGPAHAIARHIGIDVPEPPTDPEAPPLSVDPLYLGPGARIIGIVRDAAGPVAGVSLTLTPDGGGRAVGPQERPRPTRSAADGTFAFEGVPVGAVFRLQAYTSGEYAQAVFGPYEIHGGKDLTDVAVVLSRES
jgi:hypothetical protein